MEETSAILKKLEKFLEDAKTMGDEELVQLYGKAVDNLIQDIKKLNEEQWNKIQ